VAWTVGGWILWTLLALLSVRCLSAWNLDGAHRQLARMQGSALVLGLLVTAVLRTPKLHLLWITLACFVLPILVLTLYNSNASKLFRTLIDESKRTGLPFTELLRRARTKARRR
jgi:hypothetical protein